MIASCTLLCVLLSSVRFVPVNKRKTASASGLTEAVYAGADSQIRTGDLILTKDALYRLSYISIGNVKHSTRFLLKAQALPDDFFDFFVGRALSPIISALRVQPPAPRQAPHAP